MFHPCLKCNADDTVDYDNEEAPKEFVCVECGARFEIEHDADGGPEGYTDTSTPGKELEPEVAAELRRLGIASRYWPVRAFARVAR